MDEILACAEELGRKIAVSEVFIRLRGSESAVQADEPTQKLLKDFDAQRRLIEELESSKKPVEVEDKRRMRDLAGAVHADAKLQNLLRAQADYLEMMNRINRTIQLQMNPPPGGDSGTANG